MSGNRINPAKAAWEGLGITEEQWRELLTQEAERLHCARQTCDHSSYGSFDTHGRCCPNCGASMVDFGD